MKKRYMAILIDAIGLVIITTSIFVIKNKLIFFNDDILDTLVLSHTLLFFNLLYMICKDFVFGNQSIGKKLMGIEIVCLDNTIPNKRTIFVRNIFLFFNVFELISLLIFGKRIGEIVTKTYIRTKETQKD